MYLSRYKISTLIMNKELAFGLAVYSQAYSGTQSRHYFERLKATLHDFYFGSQHRPILCSLHRTNSCLQLQLLAFSDLLFLLVQ